MKQLLRDDEGATMVEYAFLVAFVALIALAGVIAFGVGVGGLFDSAVDAF